MKKLLILGVVLMANVAIGVNIAKANAEEKLEAEVGLTKGTKGSYQGTYVCHCPDDTKECYCGS